MYQGQASLYTRIYYSDFIALNKKIRAVRESFPGKIPIFKIINQSSVPRTFARINFFAA